MLNPYHVIGQALALFKAAGLPVPAYGEEEKQRLFYIILKIGLLFNAKQEALSSDDNNY